MSNRAIMLLTGIMAVLVTGFLIGLRFRSAPHEVVVPREVLKVVEVPADTVQKDYENFQLRHKVRTLETEVAAARAQAVPPPEANASIPPPVPFPRDVSPAFAPEGFHEVLEQTIRKCGMGLEVAKVDCTEYPCIAWTRATDPEVHQFSMQDCGPWRSAFPDGELVIGESGGDDRDPGSRYFAWMPMPPDGQPRSDILKRVKERRAFVEQQLGLKN